LSFAVKFHFVKMYKELRQGHNDKKTNKDYPVRRIAATPSQKGNFTAKDKDKTLTSFVYRTTDIYVFMLNFIGFYILIYRKNALKSFVFFGRGCRLLLINVIVSFFEYLEISISLYLFASKINLISTVHIFIRIFVDRAIFDK
jgi:hypothetical protein